MVPAPAQSQPATCAPCCLLTCALCCLLSGSTCSCQARIRHVLLGSSAQWTHTQPGPRSSATASSAVLACSGAGSVQRAANRAACCVPQLHGSACLHARHPPAEGHSSGTRLHVSTWLAAAAMRRPARRWRKHASAPTAQHASAPHCAACLSTPLRSMPQHPTAQHAAGAMQTRDYEGRGQPCEAAVAGCVLRAACWAPRALLLLQAASRLRAAPPAAGRAM